MIHSTVMLLSIYFQSAWKYTTKSLLIYKGETYLHLHHNSQNCKYIATEYMEMKCTKTFSLSNLCLSMQQSWWCNLIDCYKLAHHEKRSHSFHKWTVLNLVLADQWKTFFKYIGYVCFAALLRILYYCKNSVWRRELSLSRFKMWTKKNASQKRILVQVLKVHLWGTILLTSLTYSNFS